MPKLKQGTVIPDEQEDVEISLGVAADDDAYELTDREFKQMVPAAKALPAEVYEALAKRPPGRPVGSYAQVRKVPVTLRMDPDVLQALRDTGPGWQSRANDALRRLFIAKRAGR